MRKGSGASSWLFLITHGVILMSFKHGLLLRGSLIPWLQTLWHQEALKVKERRHTQRWVKSGDTC